MEPKMHHEPFDDADTGFQVKWDGIRILVHQKDRHIQLFNRKKHVRTHQYPEIVRALASLIDGDIILDGEMVALKEGKPNFPQILRRDLARDDSTITYLSKLIPVTYVVFDILFYKDEDLTSHNFRYRNELLKSLIPSKDPIVVTDTVNEHGTLLFSVVKKAGLEGIVAKKFDSPYQIGQKSSDWLKIKNFRTLVAIIGGFIYENRAVRSLLLGTFQGHEFIYLGRAGSGLSQETASLLYEKLDKIRTSQCPFTHPPKISKNFHFCWVKPSIEVKVKYMEFSDDGLIRHPVIKELIF